MLSFELAHQYPTPFGGSPPMESDLNHEELNMKNIFLHFHTFWTRHLRPDKDDRIPAKVELEIVFDKELLSIHLLAAFRLFIKIYLIFLHPTSRKCPRLVNEKSIAQDTVTSLHHNLDMK